MRLPVNHHLDFRPRLRLPFTRSSPNVLRSPCFASRSVLTKPRKNDLGRTARERQAFLHPRHRCFRDFLWSRESPWNWCSISWRETRARATEGDQRMARWKTRIRRVEAIKNIMYTSHYHIRVNPRLIKGCRAYSPGERFLG